MRMTVTAETALHLRATASKTGQILAYLRNGDVVEGYGKPDKWKWQWVRSLRTGQYGYVDADFLAAVAEAPAPKSDPVPLPMPDPLSVPPRSRALGWIGVALVLAFIAVMLFMR